MTEQEIEAERTRVMMETLGAACHHLGQPATVILTCLEALKERTRGCDDSTKELVATAAEAATSLAQMLHTLNAMTESRGVQSADPDQAPGVRG